MRKPRQGDRLVWVSLPEYTIGLLTLRGLVVDAPPIAKWAIGRNERQVADYFRSRGAEIFALDPPRSTPV